MPARMPALAIASHCCVCASCNEPGMVASNLFSSDRWSDVMSVSSVVTLLSAGCSCLTRWWPGGDQGRPLKEAEPAKDGAAIVFSMQLRKR